jgi:DNA-binding MarR family transcriptional regulator/GNAT superfamily N-acetyltransferase
MNGDQVEGVRRFNRFVVQRAGPLEELFLGGSRPPGQSRLLYEVGEDGASLRDLRIRLGLDSGYLSRLVHGLVTSGLVVLTPDEHDPRIRRATLTPDGIAELDRINERSADIAKEVLDPLDDGQRARLVQAMETVVRLLGIADLRLEVVDPTGPGATWCLEQYYRELAARFQGGFCAERSLVADAGVFRLPRGAFLLGTVDGRPVGCGALKLMQDRKGYIKRMWVHGSMRGTGLGRRLLTALEELAVEHGCTVVQLETNRALQEAQSLYRSAGYQEVEPFNDEVYAHHWFEKRVAPK